jgi:quinol-cytochrome oxidoreductase complex cytochrome b subunit
MLDILRLPMTKETLAKMTPEERSLFLLLGYLLSSSSVRNIVEMLFAAFRYTPEEQLRYVRSPKDNPYPATVSQFQRITCGHNPLLFARLVRDLHMEGEELKWTEPPPESELRQQLKDAGF